MFSIQDGREHFYQWDKDRVITVADPTIKEVHFCNKTDDCSLVVEVEQVELFVDGVSYEIVSTANVPNILLQNDFPIRVYAYCQDGYTKVERVFKVLPRTKPSDYIYTETEVKTIENEVKSVMEKELPKAVQEEAAKIVPAEVEKTLPKGELTNAIKGEYGQFNILAPTDISPLEHTIKLKGSSYSYINVYENIIPNTRTIGAIKESNGVTFTEMGNNIVIANGTNDKNGTSNYIIYDSDVSLPAGNYTVYGCGKGDKTYSSDSPYKVILYVWYEDGERIDYVCNRVNNSYSFKADKRIDRIQLKLQVAQGVGVINQEFYTILVNEDTKKRCRLGSIGTYSIDASTNFVAIGENKTYAYTMQYNRDINKVLEKIEKLLGGEI